MKNADDFFKDIELLRSPKEMKLYFELKQKEISIDLEYIQLARLKKGLFKEFFEEFFPLYYFSQSKFCDKDSRLKIVLGNQSYDAIIVKKDGQVKKLEFTEFQDGQWSNNNANELNKKGIGLLRFSDHKSLEERRDDYIKEILANAIKKAEKKYYGVSLVIVVNTTDYFERFKFDSKNFVKQLIHKLKTISFTADEVFLMIKNGDNISSINENLIKVK